MYSYEIGTIDECVRLCEKLAALMEEDQIDIRHCLEGGPLEGYRDLIGLELKLLEDCKRRIMVDR